MGYAVAGPLAIVRMGNGTMVHLYDGQPVPEDADPKDVERLVQEGFLAEVEDAPEPDAKSTAAKSKRSS